MTWITLSGLIVLSIVLVLAITFNVRLDKTATKTAIAAALFLTLALVFSSIVKYVTDPDVMVTLSSFSAVAAGLSWFFILVGLIRFASAQDNENS